ncbi:MAG: peptide chain release factor N(5)-glutamine methyltransferase [bacterium]|nr:peptide chain release factor N(5)-glutamine methyltransferase [bacterium]
MTIGDIIHDKLPGKASQKKLTFLDSDVLLEFVTNQPREYLYSYPEKELTAAEEKHFLNLRQRRLAGEPIAYLTGTKEFYDLDFIVNKDVLIPRPDTELLVDAVLNYLTDTKAQKSMIADIGTGSGNIAIAVKKNYPNCNMIATDVSKTALAVAKKNASNNKVKIKFYPGDVLAALPTSLLNSLDVICFNAPYLTKTEAKKHNLAHEPQVALTPTGEPTELIERLLVNAEKYLTTDGIIFLEIGHLQADQVTKLCYKYFPAAQVSITQDLGNFDRLITCKI